MLLLALTGCKTSSGFSPSATSLPLKGASLSNSSPCPREGPRASLRPTTATATCLYASANGSGSSSAKSAARKAKKKEKGAKAAAAKKAKISEPKAYQVRPDLDVQFGSEVYKEYEEGDEYEDESVTKERERLAKIQSLLKEQDEEFKQERKQKKWGMYANVTSREDVAALQETEREKVAKGT